MAVPGMYVLGLPFLRRRKSSFMHGAEDDVRELGAHLAAYLDQAAREARHVVPIRAACFPVPAQHPDPGCLIEPPRRPGHGPL